MSGNSATDFSVSTSPISPEIRLFSQSQSRGAMILTRIDPVQAGIERFTTRRMTAERLTSTHYPEIRRLHLHPQVMKTLSPDGQILPDNVTKEGLVQNDAHWAEHGFGYWIFRA